MDEREQKEDPSSYLLPIPVPIIGDNQEQNKEEKEEIQPIPEKKEKEEKRDSTPLKKKITELKVAEVLSPTKKTPYMSEVKPEPKPEAKPEVIPEVKVEVKPVAKAEVKEEVKVEVQTQKKIEIKPVPKNNIQEPLIQKIEEIPILLEEEHPRQELNENQGNQDQQAEPITTFRQEGIEQIQPIAIIESQEKIDLDKGLNDFLEENYGTTNAPDQEKKDQLINKLQKENGKLRVRLKEINQELDQALEKASRNFMSKKQSSNPPNVENLLKSKEQTIQSQEKLIKSLQKQLKQLQKSPNIYDGNHEERINLENELAYQKSQNMELQQEIKSLQKIQKEQSKALEKFGYRDSSAPTISPQDYKIMFEQLKSAKETIRQLEEKMKNDERVYKSQFDHMIKLEDKLKSEKALSARPKEQADLVGEQMQQLTSKVRELEKKSENLQFSRDMEQKKCKRFEKQLKEQADKFNEEIITLKSELREKEKENIISSNKIKDLRKSLKQNSVHPILGGDSINVENYLSGQLPEIVENQHLKGNARNILGDAKKQQLYSERRGVVKSSSKPKYGHGALSPIGDNYSSHHMPLGDSKHNGISQTTLRNRSKNSSQPRINQSQPSVNPKSEKMSDLNQNSEDKPGASVDQKIIAGSMDGNGEEGADNNLSHYKQTDENEESNLNE